MRHGIVALLSLVLFASCAHAHVASVYGGRDGYCGKRTASGERLDCKDLTAAHRSLPFNTRVRVTNRSNGRSVVVRINDRGPFARGRVIDVTPAGARALGFSGLARVSLHVEGRHAEANTDISAARRHHHADAGSPSAGRDFRRHNRFGHRHSVRHAKRNIAGRSVGLGHVGGMNGAFVAKLRQLNASMSKGASCSVGSGFRSHSQQAALHRAKPGLAARPGHSNHERGLAADLTCHGGGLGQAHRLASRFGLRFPMAYEPWHIEPQGATRFASRHHRPHYAMRVRMDRSSSWPTDFGG